MKFFFTILVAFFSLSAFAEQMFYCERVGDKAPVELIIKSFSIVEYSNDWDFDGTYEIATLARGQMWNSFLSNDEYLSQVELQIQGKMFHGKAGKIKEIVYDSSHVDGKVVTVFNCLTGRAPGN